MLRPVTSRIVKMSISNSSSTDSLSLQVSKHGMSPEHKFEIFPFYVKATGPISVA